MKSRSQFPLYPIFLVVCALVITSMMFFTMHFLAGVTLRSIIDWINCVILWCLMLVLLATDCVLYAQIVRYVITYHRSQVAPSPSLPLTPAPRPHPGPRRPFRGSPYWSGKDDNEL